MIFRENCLPVGDFHIYDHALFVIFEKKQHNLKLSSAANYRWCLKGYCKLLTCEQIDIQIEI